MLGLLDVQDVVKGSCRVMMSMCTHLPTWLLVCVCVCMDCSVMSCRAMMKGQCRVC